MDIRLTIITCLIGFSQTQPICLTWMLDERSLRLICRTEFFSTQMLFIGPNGDIQGDCNLTGSKFSCSTKSKHDQIIVDISTKRVILILEIVHQELDDGQWICWQKNQSVFTTVSIDKGTIDDVGDVQLVAQRLKNNKMQLECFTCREPRGLYAEFQINNQSDDGVTYNTKTGKCTYNHGDCSPNICNCSFPGHDFTRIYDMSRINNGTDLSCSFSYIDPYTTARYSRIAIVHYDGEKIITKGTETVIRKRPKDKAKDKEFSRPSSTESLLESTGYVNNESDLPWKTATISLGVVLFVVCTIAVTCVFKKYCKKQRDHCKMLQRISKLFNKDGNKRKDYRIEYPEQPEHFDVEDKIREDFRNKNPGQLEHLLVQHHSREDDTKTNMIENEEISKEDQVDDATKENTAEYPLCEPCKFQQSKGMRTVIYHCMDCAEDLCTSCKDFHLSMKRSKHHSVVRISQLPKEYNFSIFCTEHEKMKYLFLCIDHDILCCSQCISNTHSTCKKTCIEEAAENLKESTKYNKYLQTIKNVKQRSINLSTIVSAREHITEDLSKSQESDIKTLITKINNEAAMFDLISESASNELLFIFVYISYASLNEIKDSEVKLGNVCQFSPQKDIINKDSNTLKQSQYAVFKSDKGRNLQKEILVLKPTLNYRISSMSFLSNGVILFCSKENSTIYLYDGNFQFKSSSKLHFIPNEISAIPDTDCAVATIYKSPSIRKFNAMIGRSLKTVKVNDESEKNVTPQYDGYNEMCVTCTKNNILIGGIGKIYLYDHELSLKYTIETGKDVNIRSICVSNDHLCLTENGSTTLRCITMDGKGTFEKNFKLPTKIISGKNGEIFILDIAESAIHHLNSSWKKMTLIQSDLLRSPVTICFNADCTKLYVVNESGTSVLEFS